MTDTDTIKIREQEKEYLDELMDGDEISKYGSLSYADALQYLCDLHREGNLEETTSDSTGSGGVNRRSADGSEADNSKEVEDKINSVRIEDGGGTRNNERINREQGGDGASDGDSFPEDEKDVAEIDPEDLEARER